MSTLYLVMNTFSGRYLTEQSNKNIGHENINFFMPQNTNGTYLLWFNSNGTIDKKYLKNKTDITLLMVTNYANESDQYRVLAMAKDCKIVKGADVTGLKKENREKRYKEFLESFNNATYGAQTIQDIFKDNTFHGEPDPQNTLATFMTKPENVFVPVNTNYTIQIKKDKIKAPNANIKQNMANERMRMYISNEAEFQEVIKKIAWQPFDTTKNELPGYPLDINSYKEDESFFTATRTEKDELVVSNIISYSLSKSSTLLNKLNNYLIPNLSTTNLHRIEYSIDREKDHVDLRITIPGHTIIIENKIDSFIVEYPNSNIDDLKKKVKKSFEDNDKTKIDNTYWTKYTKTCNDGDKFCQLTKYYLISQIQEDIRHEKTGEKQNILHYFFLVPEYMKNKFNLDKWKYSNEYKLITYKDLLDNVYSKVHGYPYEEDILKEFKLLARNIDNSAQNRQIYNFLKKAGL